MDGIFTSHHKNVVLLEGDDDWLADSLSDDGVHSKKYSLLTNVHFFLLQNTLSDMYMYPIIPIPPDIDIPPEQLDETVADEAGMSTVLLLLIPFFVILYIFRLHGQYSRVPVT